MRRNLLIVLAHGLRSDALSDSASWPLQTPNMAKLGNRGLRLVVSSASPSDPGGMTSLLTGLHARQHGWLDPVSGGAGGAGGFPGARVSSPASWPLAVKAGGDARAPGPAGGTGGTGNGGDSATGASSGGSAGIPPHTIEGWPAALAEAGYHVAGVGCVRAIAPWLNQSVVVRDVSFIPPAGRPTDPNPAARGPQSCAYLAAIAAKGLGPAVLQQRRQRLRCGPFEPDRLLIEPDDDIDGFIMVQARLMLARLPADQPWALIVVLSGPGNDLPPPTIYSEIVAPDSVDGGFMPADLTKADALAELDYPRVLLQRLEPAKLGRIRADYLGRVSLIDYGVGRLVAVVGARQDRDRTWMIVGSDRGQLLGEHGLIGHRSFLAPALEVPLLLAPPLAANQASGGAGVPPAVGPQGPTDAALGSGFRPSGPMAGGTPAPPIEPGHREVDQGVLSTVDGAATIAALGGCDLPKSAAGRSVLPLFQDEPVRTGHHRAVVSEFGRRIMLETERYKAVFDVETHAALGLYDLLNDPDEMKNMVATPVGGNLIDSLRWRLCDALLPLRAMPR